MVMQLHALSERYVNFHLQPEGRGARAEAEHRGLLRAWTLARAADVEELLERHIRRTLEDLLAEMSAINH
jgi:DNA-binding GntR family transcriptional regulator